MLYGTVFGACCCIGAMAHAPDKQMFVVMGLPPQDMIGMAELSVATVVYTAQVS